MKLLSVFAVIGMVSSPALAAWKCDDAAKAMVQHASGEARKYHSEADVRAVDSESFVVRSGGEIIMLSKDDFGLSQEEVLGRWAFKIQEILDNKEIDLDFIDDNIVSVIQDYSAGKFLVEQKNTMDAHTSEDGRTLYVRIQDQVYLFDQGRNENGDLSLASKIVAKDKSVLTVSELKAYCSGK